MINYVCAETVNKRSKIKISWGSISPTPLVCYMLYTQIRILASSNNLYNLILPLLGQKAERNTEEGVLSNTIIIYITLTSSIGQSGIVFTSKFCCYCNYEGAHIWGQVQDVNVYLVTV